jgi:Uma2 family endonuclease
MAAPIYWTADMVRALPDDGKQYETVYGELLVSPAPRAWHEEIVGRLYEHLRSYVRKERLELHVFGSRSDISWSDDTLVEPDVCGLPLAEARTLQWAAMKTLLLAIEVLSPFECPGRSLHIARSSVRSSLTGSVMFASLANADAPGSRRALHA